MRKSLPIALICLVLGVIPGWFAVSYGLEVRGFLSRSVVTPGTIADYQWFAGAAGRDTEKSFNPIILFQDEGGVWMEAPANLLTANNVTRIGSPVTVLYDPAERGQVRLDSFQSLYASTTFFAVPALLLFMFGLYRLPLRGRGEASRFEADNDAGL